MWSSVAQIAGGVSGAYGASAVNQTNAQNSLNRIVDYNKCPNCNSNNLSIISDEEFEAMKAQQNVSNQQPISVADELKKFKELLDMGVISQEEFDSKKKQLLGL
ncbi:MAG: SHOCT domain-containing protein [Clostridia bacterium]|nr:SHOCT domain-containing protein [Clostridia bacterium]